MMITLVNRSHKQPDWSFSQKPLRVIDAEFSLASGAAYPKTFRSVLSVPTHQPLMPIVGMVFDVPTLWLKKSKFKEFFKEVHEDVQPHLDPNVEDDQCG